MAAGPEHVEPVAVAEEDRRLVLAHDELGAELDLARTGLGVAVDDLLAGLVEPLDDFHELRHGTTSLRNQDLGPGGEGRLEAVERADRRRRSPLRSSVFAAAARSVSISARAESTAAKSPRSNS